MLEVFPPTLENPTTLHLMVCMFTWLISDRAYVIGNTSWLMQWRAIPRECHRPREMFCNLLWHRVKRLDVETPGETEKQIHKTPLQKMDTLFRLSAFFISSVGSSHLLEEAPWRQHCHRNLWTRFASASELSCGGERNFFLTLVWPTLHFWRDKFPRFPLPPSNLSFSCRRRSVGTDRDKIPAKNGMRCQIL